MSASAPQKMHEEFKSGDSSHPPSSPGVCMRVCETTDNECDIAEKLATHDEISINKALLSHLSENFSASGVTRSCSDAQISELSNFVQHSDNLISQCISDV